MKETTESGHLVIPQGKVPVSAYQAIYHKLTSKVEKLRECFDSAYEITVGDICHLDTMLNQAIVHLNPQAINSSIEISFRKDEGQTFSSIEKFQIYNFSTQKPTEVIEYQFDFFAILPVEIKEVEDIVQRFKLTIKIDQDFIEEDEKDLPWIYRTFISGRNINLNIEYSDYAVARNMQVCVQDWVKSLPQKSSGKMFNFLESKSEFISAFMPFAFSAAFFIGIDNRQVNANNAFHSLSVSFALSIISFAVGRFFIVQFFRQLAQIKPQTFIIITSGDRTRKDKIIKGRSTKISIASFFAITIAAGLTVNLLSNAIWDKFFK